MALVVLLGATGDLELVELRGPQDVEHQQAMLRGDSAPRLADDHRVRYVARIADALDTVHHVARVLVQGVVHRRFVVGTAAVVVDAEAAADVDELQARAHELELRVYMGELIDRVFDAADVLQLAAGVAVHELQTIEHVALLQERVQVEDLAHKQAELRLLAGRIAPAPGAVARELDPHTDAGPHAIVLRVLQNSMNFLEILDDRDDGTA